MRIAIYVALLTCLFIRCLLAGNELTLAQTQQLVNAAQTTDAGSATGKTVKLTINGMEVEFTVKRDSSGNVIARPTVTTAGSSPIAQVYFAMSANADGTWKPKSLVIINDQGAIKGYELSLNKEGTLMNYTEKTTTVATTGSQQTVTSGTNTFSLPPIAGTTYSGNSTPAGTTSTAVSVNQ